MLEMATMLNTKHLWMLLTRLNDKSQHREPMPSAPWMTASTWRWPPSNQTWTLPFSSVRVPAALLQTPPHSPGCLSQKTHLREMVRRRELLQKMLLKLTAERPASSTAGPWDSGGYSAPSSLNIYSCILFQGNTWDHRAEAELSSIIEPCLHHHLYSQIRGIKHLTNFHHLSSIIQYRWYVVYHACIMLMHLSSHIICHYMIHDTS